jgi:hypothetical protein
MSHVALGLAASLALAGCFKVGNSVPADAPSYVKVYPGAPQVVTVDVAGMKMVTFEAAASPDQVIQFYRDDAASAGLTENTQAEAANKNANQRTLAYGDPNSDKFLIVVVQAHNTGSMVNVTYKPPAKAGS